MEAIWNIKERLGEGEVIYKLKARCKCALVHINVTTSTNACDETKKIPLYSYTCEYFGGISNKKCVLVHHKHV